MLVRVVTALAIICLLIPSIAVADVFVPTSPFSITWSYDPSTNYGQWNYHVTLNSSTEAQSFYAYLDPNMQWEYITGVGNSSTWTDPTSLGTVTSGTWTGLKFLAWTPSGSATVIDFYFEDAHYDTGGGHIMDLVDHAGPLLLDPSSNENAPSISWMDTSFTTHYLSRGDGYDVHNAITPEPATVALFGLGLLGLAARLRRRVM